MFVRTTTGNLAHFGTDKVKGMSPDAAATKCEQMNEAAKEQGLKTRYEVTEK